MGLPAADSPSSRTCDSAPGGRAAEAPADRTRLLAALVIGSVVFNSVSQFTFKANVDEVGQRYLFFFEQLGNLVYDILALAVIVFRWATSADYRRALRRSIRRVHPCYLVIPALLDGLENVLSFMGAPNVPGSWTILLGQPQVFFVMVLSAACLGAKFSTRQMIGAILTVLGAVLAVLPKLIRRSGSGQHLQLGFTLLFFSADIPGALSVVYKRWAFEKGDLDVFYLTAMVSWVQLPLTWVFLPLMSLPAFGTMRLFEIGEVMAGGAACFAGDTSIAVYDAEGNITGFCSGGLVTAVSLIQSISGFLDGICRLYIMKLGSASLYALVNVLVVPISNFLFDVPLVTLPLGLQPSAFSWTNLASVVIVVVGVSLYMLTCRPLKASSVVESNGEEMRQEVERAALS